MVQELAKSIIADAVDKYVTDLYLVPRAQSYELYERYDDERVFVGEYDEAEFAALISHFKFMAGMNVGESAAVNRAPAIMIMARAPFPCDSQPWETTAIRKVWLSASCMRAFMTSATGSTP